MQLKRREPRNQKNRFAVYVSVSVPVYVVRVFVGVRVRVCVFPVSVSVPVSVSLSVEGPAGTLTKLSIVSSMRARVVVYDKGLRK